MPQRLLSIAALASLSRISNRKTASHFFGNALASLMLASLALAACAPNGPGHDHTPAPPLGRADMIIYGGPIYTGNDDDPRVDAVAVTHGAIVAVGNRDIILKSAGPSTEIIDLNGAAMYPGFTDAHAHLLGIGLRELTLNLEDIGSINALVSAAAKAVQASEKGATVYGRGWIETGWPEGRFPTRVDLDPVSRNNPVILVRADGHAALVNSAALNAAGITDATRDPEGGRIERDQFGRATGILIDAAQSLVGELITAPTTEQKAQAYAAASKIYAAYGWTGLHNMSVDPDNIAMMESLAARDADQNAALRIRVYNAIDKDGLDWLIANAPRVSNDAHITTNALKLYVDGALGSRGAALSQPYSDQPGASGLLLMQKAEAMAIFDRAMAAGIQVNTHAIGDRGNKLVLDWYEQAFAKNPDAATSPRERRWRIEHAQILHVEDIARFGKLGVIPSMQPSHAIGDLFFAPDRLGPDRLDGAYAWRALIDAGAIIAAGSDAPVERGDPLIEFYAAVARRGLDGTQTQDWRPAQAVTRQEALKMFTAWPAYASFQEDRLGAIETGKRADFTVFSKDIMVIPVEEILTAKPVMTVVDGVVIYRSPIYPSP